MKRLTIALYVDSVYDSYQEAILSAVKDKAAEEDIHFICLRGDKISTRFFNQGQRNGIYDMVDKTNVDGLILMAGTLLNYLTIEEIKLFYKNLPDIHIVSISSPLEGVYNVKLDNEIGMKDLLDHLLHVHNVKKIAFISGPRGNYDSELRLSVYKQILAENNIAYNHELVCEGNFLFDGGKKAVNELLKERKSCCEAIVCANDHMAIAAIYELRKMGIRVPEDIIVTGFDDILEGRNLNRPLTTVRQPLYTIGIKSAEIILALLKKQCVDQLTIVPSRFIIRRSCGCFAGNQEKGQTTNGIKITTCEKPVDMEAISRELELELERIILQNDLTLAAQKKIRIWTASIIESLVNALLERNESLFYNNFDIVLQESSEGLVLPLLWEEIIFNCIFFFKLKIGDRSITFFLDNIYIQSKDIIHQNMVRISEVDRENMLRRIELINRTSLAIFHIMDLESLKNAVLAEFKNLGINNLCLSLFINEDKESQCRLFLAMRDGVEFEYTGFDPIYYPGNFIPGGMQNLKTPAKMLVMPIFHKYEQLGFIIFELGNLDNLSYDILSLQISNTVKSIYLLNQVQDYSKTLEKKVDQRTSQLEETQGELVKAAHQAGMAEVSVTLLHNVGNILNSINVSAYEILNTTQHSKIENLIKVNKLLNDNKDNLSDFLQNNESGKLLPLYYDKVGEALAKETTEIQKAAKDVVNKIVMASEIVKTRQDYVHNQLFTENIDLIQVIKSSLAVVKDKIAACNIEIVKNYSEHNPFLLKANSSRLIQVFINLFKNSIEALEINTMHPVLNINIEKSNSQVKVMITDNGIGVSKENLKKIFVYGFTTKSSGHGFGLHSCVKYLKEMNASLFISSEGIGHGTMITIVFPVQEVF